MGITAKSLKYILYIEGVQIPVQVVQLTNAVNQGCTMSATIPPHPMCYLLKRGMYVQLYKRVNNEKGRLRFSGILMNKVYSKSGDGRELRIECASPEIRLSALKISEMNAGQMSMLTKETLLGISHLENAMKKMVYNDIGDYIKDIATSEERAIQAQHITGSYDRTAFNKNDVLRKNSLIGLGELRNEYKNATDKAAFMDKTRKASAAVSDFWSTRNEISDEKKSKAFNAMKEDAYAYRLAKEQSQSKDKDEAKRSSEMVAKLEDSFKKNRDAFLGEQTNSVIRGMSLGEFVKYSEAQSNYNSIKGVVGNNTKQFNQSYLIKSNAALSNISVLSKFTGQTAYNDMVTNVKMPSDNGSTENKSTGQYDQIVKPTMARYYTDLVDKCGEDYFLALVKFIEYVYSLNEEQLVIDEAKHFKIYDRDDVGGSEHALCHLDVITPKAFQEAESGGNVVQGDTGIHYAPISYMLATTINGIINSSEGGVPVMSIILQVLQTLMASYSVVHTQFYNSIMVHPMMCNYFPPRRNVIFPRMISSIQYNANDWANPTRTYMIYKSYLQPYNYQGGWMDPSTLADQIAVAPKESRELRYINYEAMKQTYATSETESELYDQVRKSDAYKDKKDTELTVEDRSNISKASHEFSAAFKKRVEAYKLINNHYSEEEEEIGRTINIVNYGPGYYLKSDSGNQVAMADMFHGLAKYGCRSCVVTGGDELDDVVVGMPIIVMDHVYSIYGIVESLSFTAMGDGNVNTSITVSMPRMPLNNRYDVLTHAGLWFDSEAAAPDFIGLAYSKIFGKTDNDQSIYDLCRDSNSEDSNEDNVEDKLVNPSLIKNRTGMDDDTTLLKLCISRINNKYILAEDKEEFIRNFRSVKEDLEDGEPGSTMRMKSPRHDEVERYLKQLGITDGESHKYAIVTPDSLSYDDMGFIAVDVDQSKIANEAEERNMEAFLKNRYQNSFVEAMGEYKPSNVGSVPGNLPTNWVSPISSDGILVTSKFGWRSAPTAHASSFHKGIDIRASAGTSVRATADGVVKRVGPVTRCGNEVVIQHADGTETRYLHLGKTNVKKGMKVSAGESIAVVGSKDITSTSPHLHFEVHDKNGRRVNPVAYFKNSNVNVKYK